MTSLSDLRGVQERLPIDTSEEEEAFLLIGRNGGYIRASPSARQLLRMVDAGLSFEAVAERVASRTGRTYSPGELETAYREIVDRIEKIDRNTPRNALPASFWLKRTIIPSRLVAALAKRLSVAFHPGVASLLLGAVLTAIVLLLFRNPGLGFTTRSLWPGYLLFLVSLLVHEFGHASACARYGPAPSDIGFTMYLIYPAFYSDVTPAWQLKRWQRVVVDLGGNYFQYLAGAVYVVTYLLSGAEMFRTAFLMILYSSAFSLNPIFKFDGYWVLADALGVTNLGRQPARLARHWWLRLRGRPAEPLPWTPTVLAALAVYTPLSFAFWGFFLWRLLPSIWKSTVGFPGHVEEIVGLIARGGGVAWAPLQEIVVSTFFLLISYVMLGRLLSGLVGKLKSPIVEPRAKERAL
ncbi:MAG TPA: hypothetical protein VLX28_17470 [Thermoanaerobaculia bacterium]|nr:hypothetical protein [Thermoanaerobaculia bacterium]